MSLRLKLLLLGLLTLVLPWAGCRYAREMESALREGEQTSLESVAETLATSLEGRVDLLYRAPAGPEPPDTAALLKSGPYDLKPVALPAAPLIDGYSEDWPRDPAAWAWYQKETVTESPELAGTTWVMPPGLPVGPKCAQYVPPCGVVPNVAVATAVNPTSPNCAQGAKEPVSKSPLPI